MAEQPFDPVVMLAALHDANVRFVLIGGMAAILHGDVGVTLDIDIAPANDSDNLASLASARAGALDVSFTPAGTGGYPDLRRDAVAMDAAEGVTILVASLADVIRSKSAADREKDRRALPRLHGLLERTSARRND